ncbi:MAG: hypothetical protein IPJ33_15660 [Gammaproteobacteria bacterium]|nr:hypothetical protein [Gammaproteobacteria bacterium]MBK7729877.1 hypothetical protein [Gammaproteobacteria bacterium]
MSSKNHFPRFVDEETRQLQLLEIGRNESKSNKFHDDEYEKLLTLCELYGIPVGEFMFYRLSLALARELYPEKKKRGRKSKWNPIIRSALIMQIERTIQPNRAARGVAWACKVLAKREPWKSFLEEKDTGDATSDPGEALRRVYYDSLKDHEVTLWQAKVNAFESSGRDFLPTALMCVSNPKSN